MRATHAILLALCLSATMATHADSDGFYCFSENFVALERRSFDGDRGHGVMVTPLSDYGIGEGIFVEIPDFQTHAMTCESSGIHLLSWNDEYRIKRSDSSTFQYAGSSPCPDCPHRLKSEFTMQAWSTQAKDETLPANSEFGVSFDLVFGREAQAFSGVIEHTTIMKIVRKIDGKFIDSRIIYAETRSEIIH